MNSTKQSRTILKLPQLLLWVTCPEFVSVAQHMMVHVTICCQRGAFIDGEHLILKVLTRSTAESEHAFLLHNMQRGSKVMEELAVKLLELPTCSRALVRAEVIHLVDGDRFFKAIKMPRYASSLAEEFPRNCPRRWSIVRCR
jgi:hypothetical protein